jgi:hypothetical protein
MSPVGTLLVLLDVTVTANGTGDPCVRVEGVADNTVDVGLNVTLFQFNTRFATLIEPIPVAKS